MRRKILHYGLAVLAASTALMYAVSPVHAADKKPNWEGASAQPEAGRLEPRFAGETDQRHDHRRGVKSPVQL